MAEDKRIWVRATLRGQSPVNREWYGPDDGAFRIPESAFSKRWMVKVSAKDAERLNAEPEAEDDAAKVKRLEREIGAVSGERDKLAARVAELEAGQAKPAAKA